MLFELKTVSRHNLGAPTIATKLGSGTYLAIN